VNIYYIFITYKLPIIFCSVFGCFQWGTGSSSFTRLEFLWNVRFQTTERKESQSLKYHALKLKSPLIRKKKSLTRWLHPAWQHSAWSGVQ